MSRSGALVPILIVIVLAFFAQRIISPPQQDSDPTYSDFIAQINESPESIESVKINTKDNTIDVTESSRRRAGTSTRPAIRATPRDAGQLARAEQHQHHRRGQGQLVAALSADLHPPLRPHLRLLAVLMNQMQGGGSRVMNFGKSKAKRMSVERAENHVP